MSKHLHPVRGRAGGERTLHSPPGGQGRSTPAVGSCQSRRRWELQALQ